MNKLTNQDNYKKDYKPIQRWSQEHKSYATDDEQRFFAKVVSTGNRQVEIEKERENKLETFRNQRVRGTTRVNDNSNI